MTAILLFAIIASTVSIRVDDINQRRDAMMNTTCQMYFDGKLKIGDNLAQRVLNWNKARNSSTPHVFDVALNHYSRRANVRSKRSAAAIAKAVAKGTATMLGFSVASVGMDKAVTAYTKNKANQVKGHKAVPWQPAKQQKNKKYDKNNIISIDDITIASNNNNKNQVYNAGGNMNVLGGSSIYLFENGTAMTFEDVKNTFKSQLVYLGILHNTTATSIVVKDDNAFYDFHDVIIELFYNKTLVWNFLLSFCESKETWVEKIFERFIDQNKTPFMICMNDIQPIYTYYQTEYDRFIRIYNEIKKGKDIKPGKDALQTGIVVESSNNKDVDKPKILEDIDAEIEHSAKREVLNKIPSYAKNSKVYDHIQRVIMNIANVKDVNDETSLKVDVTPLDNIPEEGGCDALDLYISSVIEFLRANLHVVAHDKEIISLLDDLKGITSTKLMYINLNQPKNMADELRRNVTVLLKYDLEILFTLFDGIIYPMQKPFMYKHFNTTLVNLVLYEGYHIYADCAYRYMMSYVIDVENIQIIDTGDMIRYISKLPEYVRFIIYAAVIGLLLLTTYVIKITNGKYHILQLVFETLSGVLRGQRRVVTNTEVNAPLIPNQTLNVSAPMYPQIPQTVEQIAMKKMVV